MKTGLFLAHFWRIFRFGNNISSVCLALWTNTSFQYAQNTLWMYRVSQKSQQYFFFDLDHLYLVAPPPPTALMNSPVIISDEKIFIIDFFWDTLYLWIPFSWLVVWRNFRIVNWTESKANNLLSCRICSKPVLWSIFPIHKPPTRKWQIWGRTGHTFWQLLWWWNECCYMVNTQVPNLGFW